LATHLELPSTIGNFKVARILVLAEKEHPHTVKSIDVE
jgi:hypothetical protein